MPPRGPEAVPLTGAQGRNVVARWPIERATLALECIATLLAHEVLAHASTALATDLAVRFGCDRVAIACTHNGHLRIAGVSHRANLTTTSSLHQDILAAMDETLAQASVVVYPPPVDSKPRITLAHQELVRRHGAVNLCSIPLMREGEVLGVIMLERSDRALFDVETLSTLEQVAGLIAPIIEIKRLHACGWGEHLRDGCRSAGGKIFGRPYLGAKATLALAAVLGVALALYPIEHRVTANARVEGLVQRIIVAPADGFLKSASVRPGDSVVEGAGLAELRDDDLRLEQRKWISELAQRDSSYNEALAKLDRPQLVAAHAAIAEARAQLERIEQQVERSQLKAPIDGIIIKGDLSQSLGGSVKRGDALFMIAPRNERRVIIEVDERDVGKVQREQPGHLTLSAIPDSPMPISVTRITPVAVIANGANFFEVEAQFAHPSQPLQPGLRGVAKITIGTESALWVLSHRALDWLHLTWWTWVG